MDFYFKTLSISYKNTPLDIRERVALNEAQCAGLLQKLREVTGLQEAMILSTCNRTEVYYSSAEDLSYTIIQLLSIERGHVHNYDLFQYFDVINDNRKAVRHLFRVALGLESQVVGDLQIINQVKRAYQMSADADFAGPVLHRLLHSVFYTNKRVVQETPFRDGAASVSYATADLIRDLTQNLINPSVLILGLGEIGADVVRNVHELGFKNVFIANRTREKAEELARECSFQTVSLEEYKRYIDHCDVIVSSIGGEHLKIREAHIKSLDIPGYKHFIDLAVPRSIENAIENIPGVSLYNIDNIQAKTSEALHRRMEAMDLVQKIIDESIDEFMQWTKEMGVSPTINKFKNALEEIRKEELARYLNKLEPREAQLVEEVTRNILQKIVKLPAMHLKAACRRDDAENLIGMLNELFDLERQPVLKQKKGK
ncbi:MAG: glutamyl-tRNA reductase [Cyclobacteriaceae bacterium]|nr:glutamyl-tRNA reductase [Cyclobacteriaceae bacterium]